MADDKSEQQTASEPLEVWGDAPEKMRKGIELHVTLHVEGDAAPAADFSKSTVDAVRHIITAGSAQHP
ncbi:MAG TPA: hypothetical protein VIS78_11025, partial [Blastocatellia bacterium]